MSDNELHITHENTCQECSGTGVDRSLCPECGVEYPNNGNCPFYCHFCGEKLEEIECLQCNGSMQPDINE